MSLNVFISIQMSKIQNIYILQNIYIFSYLKCLLHSCARMKTTLEMICPLVVESFQTKHCSSGLLSAAAAVMHGQPVSS